MGFYRRMIQRSFTLSLSLCVTGVAAPRDGNPAIVIPTPKKQTPIEGAPFIVRRDATRATIAISDNATAAEKAAADYLRDRLKQDFLLDIPVMKRSEVKDENAFVILIGDIGAALRRRLDPIANDEAYAVRVETTGKGGVATLAGKSAVGTRYAAITFAQLVRRSGDVYDVAPVEIVDYPDLKYRWAHPCDRADATAYKINMTPYLGVYDKLAPETAKYQAINRLGKAEGFFPITGLFTNFGLPNRESYPDGKPYPCVGVESPAVQEEGYFQTFNRQERFRGFCYSNASLALEKLARLRQFVENNEPRCLYLHGQDRDTWLLAARTWENRCPKCRARYPGALEDADGKAKADADAINPLLDAVFSTRKPNGYDAAKDCLVVLALPPYTRWAEKDESWEKEKLFYERLGRALKYPDRVLFAIREQGFGDDGRDRVADFVEGSRKNGGGHGVVYYIAGGDTRTTKRAWPRQHTVAFRWLASPLMLASAKGCQGALAQAASPPTMLAECLWNLSSPVIPWRAPKNKTEWGQEFSKLIRGWAPEGFFEKGGFFDRIQQNLYGEKAGAKVAEATRPEPNRNGPLPPESGYQWLSLIDQSWDENDAPDVQGMWREWFAVLRDRGERALRNLEGVETVNDFKLGKTAEIGSLRQGLREGTFWADFAGDEAAFYQAVFTDSPAALERRYEALLAKLKTLPDPKTSAKFAAARRDRVNQAFASARERKQAFAAAGNALVLLRQEADTVRETVRQELRPRENYALANAAKALEISRIAVIGGAGKSWPFDELGDLVAPQRLDKVDDRIFDYDILIYWNDERKLTWEQINLLRSFVASGRGVALIGAAPYHICGGTDLTPIADWFGAASYANAEGPVKEAFASFVSQDGADWLKTLDVAPGGAAAARPITGVPALIYANAPSNAFALANKYKAGRVLFMARPFPAPRLQRALLWLGYNKI